MKMDLNTQLKYIWFGKHNSCIQEVFAEYSIRTLWDLCRHERYDLNVKKCLRGLCVGAIAEALGYYGLWLGMTEDDLYNYQKEYLKGYTVIPRLDKQTVSEEGRLWEQRRYDILKALVLKQKYVLERENVDNIAKYADMIIRGMKGDPEPVSIFSFSDKF